MRSAATRCAWGPRRICWSKDLTRSRLCGQEVGNPSAFWRATSRRRSITRGAEMKRYYDGEKIAEDLSRALEEVLGRHGVHPYSLLGLTSIMEVIASPLKAQISGIAGRDMGIHGVEAYISSTTARRVALLQSPHSQTVNQMMESISVALQKARSPLKEPGLRLRAYRIYLKEPRISLAAAEGKNSSLSSAFSSARDYLVEGRIMSRTENGAWRLSELWEMD